MMQRLLNKQMTKSVEMHVALTIMLSLFICVTPSIALSRDFEITPISEEDLFSREPVVSDTHMVAWSAYEKQKGEESASICVFTNGLHFFITDPASRTYSAPSRPEIYSNSVAWTASYSTLGDTKPNWVLIEVPEENTQLPSVVTNTVEDETSVPADADTTSTNDVTIMSPDTSSASNTREISGTLEVCLWRGGPDFLRISRDARNDINVSIWGETVAWQKAKGWPYGWEIMMWSKGVQTQLTTNYYYDMAPQVYGTKIVWYGWDGHDFEIFLFEDGKGISQLTDNQFDDVSPVIWEDQIAWEAYAGIDADIFIWKEGRIRRISDNLEDDLSPSIWNGQVVWQGFDGDDFEIYLYNGKRTVKVTSNTYDDINPSIRDDIICWMGYYDNWDAEIFIWDNEDIKQMTNNEYDDRNPKTAAGVVVWQAEPREKSMIYLARPKQQEETTRTQ